MTKKIGLQMFVFLGISFGLAWGVLVIMQVLASRSGLENGLVLFSMSETKQFSGVDLPLPGWVLYGLTRIADFSFSIAGIVMVLVLEGGKGLKTLFSRLVKFDFSKRWLLAGFLPFVFYGIAVFVTAALGTPLAFQGFSWDLLGQVLFSIQGGVLVSLFLRGAMGEELGLRGFALPTLSKKFGPVRASVLIGVFWSLWHLPVLLNRDLVSILVFLILAFLLSFVFTFLFNGAEGSLVPPLIFHALQNGEEVFEFIFPGLIGTDWELISSLLLLVFGIFVMVIMLRKPKKLTS